MIIASQQVDSNINTKVALIKLLAYFDMFDHLISLDEIQFFYSFKNKAELKNILQQLQNDQYIFLIEGFYSLRNDPLLARKRLIRNSLAKPILVIAHKVARFFFRFPYVRGIGISGSLSKNVAEKDSDIDLFIITSSNRLWIARTLLCIYIKLFYLIRRRHLYCLNYFIDEEELEIQEKNVFTAMETITLIPVCGKKAMNDFYAVNSWVSTYYRGYTKATQSQKAITKTHWIKKIVEFLFNNKAGSWLDNYLMKVTAKRWSNSEKKGKLNSKGNQFGMKAGKHFSKPNPVFFQEKLLSLYQERLNDLKLKMPELFSDANLSFEE